MDAANKERLRLLQVKRLEAVLKQPENRECFDCTALQPRWASTNLGIFLCMRCAGIHRSIGTHITKVKSISMDIWDEQMIINCETIGNGGGRAIYEARLPAGYVKPSATADTRAVERVTREKFERSAWHAVEAAPPMGVVHHVVPTVHHAPGHIHTSAQAPGHHGHAAPTPGHHVVQGSVISPGAHHSAPGVVIAASAGGATISKRAPAPAQGVVVAGTVVAASPAATAPAQPGQAAVVGGGALSFFDTIAAPPRTQPQPQQQQATYNQQPVAAKVTSQPDWGDFFSASSVSTSAPSPVVSASSQSPLFPTPQQQQQPRVDIFDPFAAAPRPTPSSALPTFSYAPTTTQGYTPSSQSQSSQQQQRGAAHGADPFSQLSAGTMQFASAPAAAPPRAVPAAVFAAAPAPAARNAIDDLFA